MSKLNQRIVALNKSEQVVGIFNIEIRESLDPLSSRIDEHKLSINIEYMSERFRAKMGSSKIYRDSSTGIFICSSSGPEIKSNKLIYLKGSIKEFDNEDIMMFGDSDELISMLADLSVTLINWGLECECLQYEKKVDSVELNDESITFNEMCKIAIREETNLEGLKTISKKINNEWSEKITLSQKLYIKEIVDGYIDKIMSRRLDMEFLRDIDM